MNPDSDENEYSEGKINIKDIHQTFWRCRDFELSNLWQRSVFLTAFLVLFFTAYGTILSKMLDISHDDHSYFLILDSICYALSLLGVTFSVMWIKMAKGSKAWYEAYESAIRAIERSKDYTNKEAAAIGGFSYNRLEGYDGIRINNSIMSGKAGEYSVSKLNIGIGQVFFLLWVVIGLIHTFIGAVYLHRGKGLDALDVIVGVIGTLVLIIFSFLISRKRAFASSSLKSFKRPKT